MANRSGRTTRSDADGNVLRGTYLELSRRRHRIEREDEQPYIAPGPPGTVNWTRSAHR